jgi:DNA-directed RNA polymerase alpha subunit
VSADAEVPARGWTARQPDETLVEDLPLRQHTINALRAGGVLTLGELRAMPDRDLMALRQFGRGTLADVRAIVPSPTGTGP